MSDLSNLLGSVYDSQNPDARRIPLEPRADHRVGADLEQALSDAIDDAAAPAPQPQPQPYAAPAPAPAPAPAAERYVPAPAPAPAPQPHYVPEQPVYATPMASWRAGDDDIVPGAVAKRGKKR